MKKFELYDILTLEDNREYTIAHMITYNYATYFYLIEVDKNENLIENNQMIVKLIISDGEESVEKVTEEKEYKEVAKLFFQLFKEMSEECSDN